MKDAKPNYVIPFVLVTSLFFLCGISNNLTGILIPHLRKVLLVTNTQSAFVDMAVYPAYFSATIPAGALQKRFGYKSINRTASGSIGKALRHKHLVWAVTAPFFCVGAQVCVTSFFVRMAVVGGGVDEKTAGYYPGVYGLLFMSGRFIGTIIMRYLPPATLLSLYASLCILLSGVAVFADGKNVVPALGGLGFFMSIIGGAIFPVMMGEIIDNAGMIYKKAILYRWYAFL